MSKTEVFPGTQNHSSPATVVQLATSNLPWSNARKVRCFSSRKPLSFESDDMVKIIPLDQPTVSPIEMPDRFRKEVVYFMTPAEGANSPSLAKDEYWVRLEDSKRWLDDGFFSLVSPLDAHSVAEIELTEDQETWLEWMVKNEITSIRLANSVPK